MGDVVIPGALVFAVTRFVMGFGSCVVLAFYWSRDSRRGGS